jgi:adenylyltransferase/sulfurtransferase
MSLPPLVEPVAALPEAERGRTDRQRRLPEFGDLGQRRLAAARVVVIGTGGLGAPALTYLAAAGVGTIGIVDDDVVELSNLHRQPVHGVSDVGRPKVESAAESIAALAPDAVIVRHHVRLGPENARELLSAYDLVVDGTDTFETRYLVDDVCAELELPLVWATVLRFDAQLSVFWAAPPVGDGVRLRTLFPEPPAPGEVPSCAEAGVLGALCGQVGAMMAQEAIKLITGIGEPLLGRVLVIDALRARQREITLRPAPVASGESASSVRADAPTGTAGMSREAHSAEADVPTPQGAGHAGAAAAVGAAASHASAGSEPGSSGLARESTTPPMPGAAHGADPAAAIEWTDVETLRERLRRRDDEDDRFVLVDVREPDEYEAGAIPGSVLLPLGEVLRDPGGVRAALGARDANSSDPSDADAAPLIVHCRTDRRAERAALALARAGEPVTVVGGGYLAWADLEHEDEALAPPAENPGEARNLLRLNPRSTQPGGGSDTSGSRATDTRAQSVASDDTTPSPDHATARVDGTIRA